MTQEDYEKGFKNLALRKHNYERIVVTFSGIFSKRADKALQKYSGLLTVDLDHIGTPADWIDRLLLDEYFETELLFASPSGDGLKWIIPIMQPTKEKVISFCKAALPFLAFNPLIWTHINFRVLRPIVKV